MNPATCGSCGAQIVWGVTTNGKRIPLNLPSEKRFVRARGEVQPQPDGLVMQVETWVSHFATCPNAAQHRKPRTAHAPD